MSAKDTNNTFVNTLVGVLTAIMVSAFVAAVLYLAFEFF